MVEETTHQGDSGPIVIGNGATKVDIRKKMWEYIEQNDLADAPRPVYNRIPNFKDRNAAAEHLTSFEFFQKAQTVKINPDKPQEWARFLALEAKKDLLVPTPRLRGGLFNRIVPTGQDKETLKSCASTQGIRKFSTPVGLDAKVKVDMIVTGSVAVSKQGYRIGKGEGFADLEYAMMRTMGATDENTLVVTTAHDCQVVDIPEAIMEDHDFMVDYILTPTQVIKCEKNREQPTGIIWSKLSPRKLSKIPILKELREREKEEGKDVELKKLSEESEEEEERMRRRQGRRQGRNRRFRRSRNYGEENENEPGTKSLSVKYDFAKERREVSMREGEGGSDGEGKPLRPSNRDVDRRRRYRKTRYNGPRRRESGDSDTERAPRHDSDRENSFSDGERRSGSERDNRRGERTSSSEDRPQRAYRYGYRNRGPVRRYRGSPKRDYDFKPSVYIGNVPSTLRVSTFKAAVREKGIQPLAVLWKHGYAFLLMPDMDKAKDAVDTLFDIEFEGQGVKVELSRLSQERGGNKEEDGSYDKENIINEEASNDGKPRVQSKREDESVSAKEEKDRDAVTA